jgi:tRNA A37 N6-isopentenylltransferase MiaA
MIRALEVFFLTGTPLTAHFAATVSPLAGYQTIAVGLAPPMTLISERTARRCRCAV